ncbi:MAG TPA: DUF488 domain-containing protein [Mucilaginibacter sp.]|nr:DUF488 domain-containing protein [Mucilaginibacter sp.]
MKLKIKRVYDNPAKDDGMRILVDRLWPRGLTKQKAKVDVWLKGIAPSTELRKWFAHDPEKWSEFIRKYKLELDENNDQTAILKEYLKQGPVTLLYGARDELHNEALVIKQLFSADAAI